MSLAFSDSHPALDAAPHKSILAAWAVALILLSAGELFISFHARIEQRVPGVPAGQEQYAALEDDLAW